LIDIDQLDPERAVEFAAAICRARPSRLNNVIEIEVAHRPDQHIHNSVQIICDRGVRVLALRTVDPRSPLIPADPLAYMMFEYEDGEVVDQWTEMSHRDGDEPMVDVLKIAFTKKTIMNCVRPTDG